MFGSIFVFQGMDPLFPIFSLLMMFSYFLKAFACQVRLVSDLLQDFCNASGLKVNLFKSRAMCYANVSRQRKELFNSISSIRFAADLGKYLGFPLVSKRLSAGT